MACTGVFMYVTNPGFSDMSISSGLKPLAGDQEKWCRRPESLKPLGRKQLKRTHFPHLHIMRPIISPNQILSISTKLGSRPTPVAVRQLLVLLLQHLFRQLAVRYDHVQDRPKPHGYDRPVLLSPFGVATEPDRFNVVEVSDDGFWPWARWEVEPEAVVEGVKEDDQGEGEK
ncbi:hypothetical protein HanIR_Chr12g0598611 [Helianthus annuus]|nr:hypothetical protein HanIR_Chr12g0598611 [Helianthus annuus]